VPFRAVSAVQRSGPPLLDVRHISRRCCLVCHRRIVHVENAEKGRLRLEGRRERRPRGFAHGRQERRIFLLISSLIRLMHLLSLNREDYLTPKQGLDLIPKPNPNGPTELAHWTRPISPLTLPALFQAARPRAAARALCQ
jgi:hypothetical protein